MVIKEQHIICFSCDMEHPQNKIILVLFITLTVNHYFTLSFEGKQLFIKKKNTKHSILYSEDLSTLKFSMVEN